MIHVPKRVAIRYTKNRDKAGNKPLNTNRQDTKRRILLVLECIHEQCIQGTIPQDLRHRCEVNHYYLTQILNHLLQHQLIYSMDSIDDSELQHTYYFLTQKGNEFYLALKQEMEVKGFIPKLNKPRDRRPVTSTSSESFSYE